jgi:hypothetical protein
MRSRFNMKREINPSSLSRLANTTSRLTNTTKITAKSRRVTFSPIGDRSLSGIFDRGFAIPVDTNLADTFDL